MEHIQIVVKFIRNIVWGLVINGIIALTVGFLILFFPRLIILLISFLLIVSGILSLILAAKASKFSKIDIRLP